MFPAPPVLKQAHPLPVPPGPFFLFWAGLPRALPFPDHNSLAPSAAHATGGLRPFGGRERLGGAQRDPGRRGGRLRGRVGVVRRRDQG